MPIIVAQSGVSFSSIPGVVGFRATNGQPVDSQYKLTTERVIVFKDGVGLTFQQGTATAIASGNVFCQGGS